MRLRHLRAVRALPLRIVALVDDESLGNRRCISDRGSGDRRRSLGDFPSPPTPRQGVPARAAVFHFDEREAVNPRRGRRVELYQQHGEEENSGNERRQREPRRRAGREAGDGAGGAGAVRTPRPAQGFG